MKKSVKNSVNSASALEVLLESTRQTKAGVSALTEQFSSVISLAQADIPRLMKQNPQMHITEARDIHARAQAMAVVIARQFREQRLTASVRHANRAATGIKGLVDGPTYTDMFNPDWANHCPPDAIEATTSPVAYLADLYRFAQDLESTGNATQIIGLDARRPDLKDMTLDHTALNRVEPTIVLVNEILERSIRSHLDGIALEDKSVDDALLEVRYPNPLPFERYTSQINYTLGRKGYSLGDAIRAADPDYPYFKEPGVHSLLSDTAMIQDTGFGPVQQGLLLEAPYFPEQDAAVHPLGASRWRVDPRTRLMRETIDANDPTTFFLDNFGGSGFTELQDTQTFCLRTGLDTDELEALLSVGAYAASRSPNVKSTSTNPVDGSLSGSVYINAGKFPAMGIETLQADADGAGPRHRITEASHDRFDRMNRMIRLARWLDLPFDQVDQLLVATMQAERHAAAVTRRAGAGEANAYLITQNTLRALGLFQTVRSRYKVTPEDFSALLYGLGEYGRGKTASQFDRVFNSEALFEVPLILNGDPFVITPTDEAQRQRVDHLCAALGLTYEAYRFVAKVVEQTYSGVPITWSREVVSAFYRLAKLPRYIGLSTVEALALLELLDGGGSQLVSKLAGTTQIATHYASANTDTLSVLHALVDFSAWAKDNKWTTAQLCRLVLPSITQPMATDAEHNLLQEMHSRLTSALVTDSSFAQVGAPDAAVTMRRDASGKNTYAGETIDWFEALGNFIEGGLSAPAARCLVKHLVGETEETFESALSAEVKRACENYGLAVEDLHPKITNMIMRARGAQEALLMEGLGGYLNTSADMAKALLNWAKGNRYTLLLEVVRVSGANSLGVVPIGDEVLLVLEALVKRATVSSNLDLSPALITQLVEHPDWFGLKDAELSLQKIYFLTQYAMTLRLSEQNEDTVLDYFRLINTLWGSSTDGDKRLIRDSAANKLAGFLRWGVREALGSALHLEPESGVIFTLREFDTMVRMALFSRDTSLDVKALLALHTLTPTTPTGLYRQAAELALSCLTDSPRGSSMEEVGQSLSSVITVTPDYLVANREGDSATYTITLRDFMDEPFEGITVRWSTDLGLLQQSETTTDRLGVCTTLLESGSVLGAATVVATFGLGETLKAPAVTIDCDEETIHFADGVIEGAPALANRLQPVYFTVTALDEFGNKAIDRPINWGTTLGEFQRYQTFTDQAGCTRAELRSSPHGTAEVIAQYSNGRDWEFIPVEFVSVPYFQYVRFSSTVVVDVEVLVTCRLVELNGTPKAGEAVTWSADFGALLDVTSETDNDGVATARYKATEVGNVIVGVAAAAPVVAKNSERTIVHPMAEIVRKEASSDEFLVGSPSPAVFKVWLEIDGAVAPRTEVAWSTSEGKTGSSYSDKDGVASFNSTFKRGVHTVTATVSGSPNAVTFNVVAMPPVEFVVSLSGDVRDEASPLLLSRIANNYLHVKIADESGEAIDGIEFSLDFVGQDPSLMQLSIAGLGEKHLSTLEGTDFLIKARPGDKGDFTLKLTGPLLEDWQQTYQLGWIYRYNIARLWSDGQLDLKWTCLATDLDPYEGPPVERVGSVTFSVPEKDLSFPVSVTLETRPLYLGTPTEDLSGLTHGVSTTVTRLAALDGYLIVLAGEVSLTTH